MALIFDRAFYARPATEVARDLLGAVLVCQATGQRVAGRIVETEAYRTVDDRASHGRRRTPRSALMWGPPGFAYVYLTYGIHWLCNVVCEPAEQPAAVLIRALEPLDGLPVMAANRAGRALREWTSGPGRLTLALGITGALNGVDVTAAAQGLWIEAGAPVSDESVRTGPRIGLGRHVDEPWLSQPWRWWLPGSPYVSRR